MHALSCEGQYLGLSRCRCGRLGQSWHSRTGTGHCCRRFGRLLQSQCGNQLSKPRDSNAAERTGKPQMVVVQDQLRMQLLRSMHRLSPVRSAPAAAAQLPQCPPRLWSPEAAALPLAPRLAPLQTRQLDQIALHHLPCMLIVGVCYVCVIRC